MLSTLLYALIHDAPASVVTKLFTCEIFLITLFPVSAIYKLFKLSIVMPNGLLYLEDKSDPFTNPVTEGFVNPDNVETFKVFTAIRRIELLEVSVI